MAQDNGAFSVTPTAALAGSAIAAGLWFAAVVALPGLQRSGLSVVVARIAVHLILLSGTWAGLARTPLTASERAWTWLAIAVPLTLWHGVTWAIVADGLLLPGATAIPLLPVMIIVPTAIAITLVARSRRIGTLLDAMPATWLIGVQFYRVIGAVFLANWLAGATPGVFALPAGIGDVITGLMALPTAVMLAHGRPDSPRAALLWNLFGTTDLIVALVMGALTSPGPFQHLAFDHPNLTVAAYPTGIIPAFTVPSSLVLHTLSVRQLLRRRRPAAAVAA